MFAVLLGVGNMMLEALYGLNDYRKKGRLYTLKIYVLDAPRLKKLRQLAYEAKQQHGYFEYRS